MPLTVQMSTLETPPPGTVPIEEMVEHPLSPTQEQVSDSIVRVLFQFQFQCLIDPPHLITVSFC